MRRGRAHAGLTFLEVVISLAMLAGVTSVILGAVGFIENAAVRDRMRLDATEVAHRVVIQYIDDPSWLKNQPKRYIYNERPYVFKYEEQYLLDGEEGVAASAETTEDFDDIVASAMRVVTVTVWLEGEGGVVEPEPLAVLSRTYWLGRDERTMSALMEQLMRTLTEQGGAE